MGRFASPPRQHAPNVCLAIPGQVVVSMPDQPLLARVDVGGVRRNVNVGLLEDGEVRLGDWVLIHVGFALSKISEAQAQDQQRMLRSDGRGELPIEEVGGYTFDGRRPGERTAYEIRRRVPRPASSSGVGEEIARRVAPAPALPDHGSVRWAYARDLPVRAERLLPENIELVHGPGCPVCVLPMGRMDDGLDLADDPD